MHRHRHMSKFILICILFSNLHQRLNAQPKKDEILKTYHIQEYTVNLLKSQKAVETTLEIRLPSETADYAYGEYYQVVKNDSTIAGLAYNEGECTIYFDEYKKTPNGDYAYDHATILNLCKLTVRKETPPDLPWLNKQIDSITIYPLDSILDRDNYQGQKTIITDYTNRKPEKLNALNASNFIFLYGNPSPIHFSPPSESRIEHYKVSLYANGQAYDIYLYYDRFYYQTWSFSINYSIYGVYNVAKMTWDKHEADKNKETD